MSGICPNVVTIPISDVKPEEGAAIKMPTVEDYYAMTKKMPVLVAQPYPPMSALVKGILDGAVVHAGLDLASGQDQTTVCLTPSRKSKHAPINFDEATRLYLLGTRMSAIVEAVRGNRAAGGCANDVRNHLRAAGVYKEPVKA